MPTLTINTQASDGGPSASSSFTVTAVGEEKYVGSIPNTTATAGQLVSMSFVHTAVAGVFLLSTQNLTVNVNSDGTPAQTIPLVANVPVQTNPFTVDVTALYLRNSSTVVAAQVSIFVMLNSSSS